MTMETISGDKPKAFRYRTLIAATRGFSQKIGEGATGAVFKGVLEEGVEVAVKRLAAGPPQSDKYFVNEAALLWQVQHRNVVRLYGYCVHGKERLLVCEYIPHGSLHDILFNSPLNSPQRARLEWQWRYKVMVGVSHGLLYLHKDAPTPIIHRDIKPGNILVDVGCVPKIADFGIARLFPEGVTQSTATKVGSYGYVDPNYLLYGSLSDKVDVYSFGILVLELVSGRPSLSFPFPGSDANSLLSWAWELYEEERELEMLDPALRSTADLQQVAMCVQLGLLCTQSSTKLRPGMEKVVVTLSRKPRKLPEPTRPVFSSNSFKQPDAPWPSKEPSSRSFLSSSSTLAAGSLNFSLSPCNTATPQEDG